MVAFLRTPPIAELRQTSAQTLSNATSTALLFDTEDVDSAAGHSTSSNTSRYTAVYDGWYQLSGGAGFAANTTGVRLLLWQVNGTSLPQGGAIIGATSALVARVAARTVHAYLNVGDYVELSAYQSSGGNLAMSVSVGDQPSMSVRWVST
jgi:hypothetical protein